MKLMNNFKENKRYKEKYNTEHIERLTLQAENDRKDIIIEELKEAISSVRKIWIDANNEKELEIVRLNNEIIKLKESKNEKKKES